MIQACKSRLQLKGKRRRRYVLQVERENGEIEKLTFDEELICWEEFRNVGGRLARAAYKKSEGFIEGAKSSTQSLTPSDAKNELLSLADFIKERKF